MRCELRFRLFALGVLVVATAMCAQATERYTGPWDVKTLYQVPDASWGEVHDGLQEVHFQNEPYQGKPSRVFAYYARPRGDGPFPAMVLIHGGGGTAFSEWVQLWAARGYAAIAMDLAGCGPDKRPLANGGPGQGHDMKFGQFTGENVQAMWTYHAVAAAVRAHSLVRGLDNVDPNRTGVTGISWGGYLTCIVAGVDDRFRVAVPVYGCGFLHENSTWLDDFERLGPKRTARWVAEFDPSRYLPGVSCPIFFLNGTNDFAYPLDSYQKSYRAVPGRVDVRVEVRMPHSHRAGWAPKEIGLYVDHILKDEAPLPRLEPMCAENGTASAAFQAEVPVVAGHLHFTADTGPWKERKWQTREATVTTSRVSAELPAARPLVCYLSVTDSRGAMMSTHHVELAPPKGKMEK